jgi:hypothetical protein
MLLDKKIRFMKKKQSIKPILGVGWYKKDQWDLLKKSSVDRNDLENTYEQWLDNATEAIKNFSKSGYQIEKIDIDVQEMIEWCKNEGCTINGESRSKYISLKTKENH